VKFYPGFKIRATDYNPAYADERNGEALATLAAAQSAGPLRVVDFSTHAGDAFAGHLLELLGSRNSAARSREFPIVFASHVLYHCESPGSAERLIDDVTQNLLSDEGHLHPVSSQQNPADLPGFSRALWQQLRRRRAQ